MSCTRRDRSVSSSMSRQQNWQQQYGPVKHVDASPPNLLILSSWGDRDKSVSLEETLCLQIVRGHLDVRCQADEFLVMRQTPTMRLHHSSWSAAKQCISGHLVMLELQVYTVSLSQTLITM